MFWLLIFIVFPLVELWLLIKTGQVYGAFTSLGLILATGLAGLLLVQMQWQKLAEKMLSQLKSGQFNLSFIQEGAALGVAGVLLFLPGFISDFFGLLLIFPLTRNILLAKFFAKATASAHFTHTTSSAENCRPNSQQVHQGEILEGEFKRKD